MMVIARLILLVSLGRMALAQQQQDPTTMNGGSILAMAGKGSVAVAVDKRFGSGPQV
jgi:20S proteasome alpha/beta subunit